MYEGCRWKTRRSAFNDGKWGNHKVRKHSQENFEYGI